jgi:hypothetical protein
VYSIRKIQSDSEEPVRFTAAFAFRIRQTEESVTTRRQVEFIECGAYPRQTTRIHGQTVSDALRPDDTKRRRCLGAVGGASLTMGTGCPGRIHSGRA